MQTWKLEAIREYFEGQLQDEMNKIFYNMSRKYKNPAVFQIDKNRKDLAIATSCFCGKWDEEITCAWYGYESDYHDYYKEHDMLVIVNQTYGHRKNTIKMKTTTSFEFGLDKFMPVIYVEYQLENDTDEITKNLLLHICNGPNWYNTFTKAYKKGYKR